MSLKGPAGYVGPANQGVSCQGGRRALGTSNSKGKPRGRGFNTSKPVYLAGATGRECGNQLFSQKKPPIGWFIRLIPTHSPRIAPAS